MVNFWGAVLFQRLCLSSWRRCSISEARTYFWGADLFLRCCSTSETRSCFWGTVPILRLGSISVVRPISIYYFLFLMGSLIPKAHSIVVRAGCVDVGCLLRNTILTSKELETRISSINDTDCSLNFPGGLSEDAVISTGHNGLSTKWWRNHVLILIQVMDSH